MFGGQVLGLFDEVGDRYSSEGAGAVAVCVFIVAEELNDIVLILLYNRLPYRIIRNKVANKMRVVCWVEAARQLIGVCVVDTTPSASDDDSHTLFFFFFFNKI